MKHLGPKPAQISFSNDCFETVGTETVFVVLHNVTVGGPKKFSNRAEAEADAKRCNREVIEETRAIQRRIKWA